DVGRKPLANEIMRSVIDLGHSLGLKVVAEGIENDWQARLLRKLKCDYLQGYYLGTPMLLDELCSYRDREEGRDKLLRAVDEPTHLDLRASA
ncbi:MAG: EAL domain-containing protein, partial [Pseudomonadota bacterium]|nr:EAL domain-containing protein [Pseudomonadota bacterium]